jgi:hypothetical protein
MTTEASITITKDEGKITFISVQMPIWTKWNDFGNLSVRIPLLGLETIAKDDNDAEKAIEEAIVSFCVVAEKFGQGIEKELAVLGWRCAGNDNLAYDINDTDVVLEEIFKTSESYVNPRLKLELELAA